MSFGQIRGPGQTESRTALRRKGTKGKPIPGFRLRGCKVSLAQLQSSQQFCKMFVVDSSNSFSLLLNYSKFIYEYFIFC